MSKFSAFNINKKVINSLNRQKYVEPSLIQKEVLPKAISGSNLIVKSETGSGKTHSYLIPIINNICNNKNQNKYSIIICPTNELARQVYGFIKMFKSDIDSIKPFLLTSDVSENSQIKDLNNQFYNIIIALPGRLKSIFNKSNLKINLINTLVLDEADMLFDLGFLDTISYLFDQSYKFQILVFSATLENNLKSKINNLIGSNYELIHENNNTSKNVTHYLIDLHHKDVKESIINFLNIKNPYFIIIFASNKTTVIDIYNYLKSKKLLVTYITGDLNERERKNTIKRIKNNEFQIVVASDLISRGLDILDVSDILSVDLPYDLTYYYHRAGRSGRFNKKGNSYVFYNKDDTNKINVLLNDGLIFNYLSLKDNELKSVEKINFERKKNKKISDELLKNIKKIKYENKNNKVKPGYKKKVKKEIEKLKRKERRNMIKKDIRRQRVERYKMEARNNGKE